MRMFSHFLKDVFTERGMSARCTSCTPFSFRFKLGLLCHQHWLCAFIFKPKIVSLCPLMVMEWCPMTPSKVLKKEEISFYEQETKKQDDISFQIHSHSASDRDFHTEKGKNTEDSDKRFFPRILCITMLTLYFYYETQRSCRSSSFRL